ncbi:MAG: 2-hydroxycarboxylate transporter family protein [Pantoea sp.]|uniref:2-hydroxycarboxylate transporter family protein n=1 Tax=Pantoea sp. TaxID=69393 RepID=UPI0039E61C01
MSSSDDSCIAPQVKKRNQNHALSNKRLARIRHRWWYVMDNWKVGIIPLPLFVLAGALITFECVSGKLPSDIVVMVTTMAFFGFACGEFGKRLPLVGKLGAAAICATFIPSMMVHYGWLPDDVIHSTTQFYKSTNIIYLYVCCIIVGSIMSMDRTVLIQGFLRIFIPMLCGEIVGMLVGVGVGMAFGLPPFQVFFFLVLPIMAGGVGEGAIPLSMGYATLLHIQQGAALGKILPVVMLGSLTAIVLAGILNQLGRRYPQLSGEGNLLRNKQDHASPSLTADMSASLGPATLASGALLALLLYMLGMAGQRLTAIPAPVIMLFCAVMVKLVQGVSPTIEKGSIAVYQFFRSAVTYPILFAVGVSITPWQELVDAFTLQNLAIIISTVVSLVITGFFVGRKMGLYPVDVAIVSCCQSGQGGTGDVAILTAGNRMGLMPFAQIATRTGGAINVAVGLMVIAHFFS